MTSSCFGLRKPELDKDNATWTQFQLLILIWSLHFNITSEMENPLRVCTREFNLYFNYLNGWPPLSSNNASDIFILFCLILLVYYLLYLNVSSAWLSSEKKDFTEVFETKSILKTHPPKGNGLTCPNQMKH